MKQSGSSTSFAPNTTGFAFRETFLFCKLDLVLELRKIAQGTKCNRFPWVQLQEMGIEEDSTSQDSRMNEVKYVYDANESANVPDLYIPELASKATVMMAASAR